MRQRLVVTGDHLALSPDDVYAFVLRFEDHADRTTAVRSIEVTTGDDGERRSAWSVNFRNGLLCWTQIDRFDHARRTLSFTLTQGDPVFLDGSWSVTTVNGHTRLTFDCRFDLGVGTLSSALDPLAGRILKETIIAHMSQLLGPAAAMVADGPHPDHSPT